MRIALLFSGLPRMWRECFETQRRLFDGIEPAVFFHFWDTVDANEKRAMLEVMRPQAFLFECPVDFGFVEDYPEIRPDNINVPSRMISQYVSWRKVATLFQPYAPRFDLAARTRSDLHFFERLDYDLRTLVHGEIGLLAHDWPEDPQFLSDLFAIGKPRAIVYYLSLLDRVWDYAKVCPFNPEALLTKHIESGTADVGPSIFAMSELPFFVFRPHMIDWPLDLCRAEGPGVSKWRDDEIMAAHRRYHTARRAQAGADHVDRFAQVRLSRSPLPMPRP